MVSVIIPVYNAAPFVRKAVESAISLAEVTEVLLIEDNSPDDSLAVCQALAREYAKVKLLRHPDGGNHGAGASRNLGIRNARGQYIAFLDADDWYLPNRFQTSLPILESRPDVDGVFEAVVPEFVTEDLRQEWLAIGLPRLHTFCGHQSGNGLLDALCASASLQTNGFTFRSAIFKQVGRFDEDRILSAVCEDTAMWWKMAIKARVVAGNLATPVAVHLVHPGNGCFFKKREQIIDAHLVLWRLLWKWCKDNRISFNKRRLLLGRLVSSELRTLKRLPKALRLLLSIPRLTTLLMSNQRDWSLTPLEILYAYYHVSGLHGLVHHLARLAGKAQ